MQDAASTEPDKDPQQIRRVIAIDVPSHPATICQLLVFNPHIGSALVVYSYKRKTTHDCAAVTKRSARPLAGRRLRFEDLHYRLGRKRMRRSASVRGRGRGW
ncbi:hypothetical protein GCM10009105_27850 [Dokdonella soli]|uniref:Uncharacterized protein n=1 Tax=Dokdonella soli TaxID=529810 RepID=A0ABP3TWK8_9GAMM